jgi:16S rRNA processing protein RimM
MAEQSAGGISQDRIVILGRVAGTFGVEGWIKVQSHTDPPENILRYGLWQIGRGGHWSGAEVAQGRVTHRGVLARLAGIDSPEDARVYVGADIGVRRAELPPPTAGEYYLHDLEGLMAVTPAGASLGRIDHFRSTPGGSVVVVRGEREHWIPFVKERILKIDLDAGRVVLDWASDW